MRMRAEVHYGKKTTDSQIRSMQDCMARCDQRLFMFISLTTPML